MGRTCLCRARHGRQVRTNVIVFASLTDGFALRDGRSCWTLFDSGARNTYVVKDVDSFLPSFELEEPQRVSLGGKIHNIVRDCRLACLVEGLPIRTNARVLEEIGADEEGKRIEILIGTLAMQEWGIRLILDEERLDMSHYPKEFIEF